ncbi:MAG: ATP-binding cassette domain-containing protein [Bacteroidota bacterium]
MIALDQVCPAPLEASLTKKSAEEEKSEIWQQEIKLDAGKKIQLNAPSGKGKSTFVHLLYGIRQDYQGEIHWKGKNLKQLSAKEWVQIRQYEMSIVFQDLRLFSHLTALENIQVKSVLYDEDKTLEIKELANQMGILPLMDKKAAFLSYGEKQRVAIIRALIQPFELLLLDEPFSHLDEENIRVICSLMEEKCAQQSAGLLMTSLGYPYYIHFDQKLIL